MRKVVILSPFATQSGYGHHAREVITQLINKKSAEWDIKLVSMPWGHTPMTYPFPAEWQNRIIGLPLAEQPDVFIQISVPNELQPVGKYNIGVTAGTEGDICPAEWIDKINAMNLIIVPSQFTKHVFENTARHHGVDILTKIEVIPEYFDETVYNGKPETRFTALDSIPESSALLSVGHWLSGQVGEDRKNLSGLIHCFFTTYRNAKSAPALVLKTSGATYSVMDRMEIENKINQIRDMFGKATLPAVYVLHGDLTDEEMNSLYNHPKIKAMISFTKAEGFGRPLLEFSTTAKPIIAPHYSGQADFMKRDFICALPGQLTPIHASAQNEFLIGTAKWFTPDYKFAGDMMKEVLKNYDKWMILAKRQRFFANSTFTATEVSKTYDAVLERVDAALESVPRTVELKLPKLQKI